MGRQSWKLTQNTAHLPLNSRALQLMLSCFQRRIQINFSLNWADVPREYHLSIILKRLCHFHIKHLASSCSTAPPHHPPNLSPPVDQHCNKRLNGRICSLPLLHNVMNFKWLLFNLALHKVWYFAENLEGEQALFHRRWEAVLDLKFALSLPSWKKKKKKTAIQQVIRDAKKTTGNSQTQSHLGTSIC